MSNHTPGPWVAKESEFPKVINIHVNVEGSPIANVATDFNWRPKEEGKANAQLIAAAPEMYDALKELVDLVEGIMLGDYKPDSFTLQPARFAISKAEGSEEPCL